MAALEAGKITEAQAAINMFTSTVGTMSPLGFSSSWLTMVTPTAIDPFAELGMNMDWIGNAIYPENNFGLPLWHRSQKFSPMSTSKLSIKASNLLNKIGGGDDIKPPNDPWGFMNTYPDMWDHIFDFTTAGAPKLFLRLGAFAEDVYMGEDIAKSQVPIFRRFLAENEDFRDRYRYIRASEKAAKAYEIYTAYQENRESEKAATFKQENRELIRAYTTIFKPINKQRKELYSRYTDSSVERKAFIEEKLDALHKKGLKKYFERGLLL